MFSETMEKHLCSVHEITFQSATHLKHDRSSEFGEWRIRDSTQIQTHGYYLQSTIYDSCYPSAWVKLVEDINTDLFADKNVRYLSSEAYSTMVNDVSRIGIPVTNICHLVFDYALLARFPDNWCVEYAESGNQRLPFILL